MSTPPDAPRLTTEELHAVYERHRAADPRAGVAVLEQICLDNQRWGLAYDLLARLLEASGDDERAYDAFRTGMQIGLRSRRLGRELKADLVLKVINFCLRRAWHERARSHVDDLVDFAPRHPLVATLQARIGEGDAGSVVADHVSRRRRVQSLLRAAREQFEQDHLEEARALYHDALTEDDRCTNAYIFLAQTYARLPATAQTEGIAFFEALVESQPGWGLALNLIGQLYEATGRDEDAWGALNRAADLSDTSPTLDAGRKIELRVRLITFCQARGWSTRAEHQLERLVHLAPDHALVAGRVAHGDEPDEAGLLASARAARDAGDADAAITGYLATTERAPRCRDAYVELAELYGARPATWAAGLAWLDALVDRAPRWGLAWRLLGELRARSGDDEGAYRAYDRALEVSLASKTLADAIKADNLLALVDFCSQRQWFGRALGHVEALLALQPEHAGGRALHGLLTLQVGRGAAPGRGDEG